MQSVDLASFTGGLNLRADAFELGDTQSPDMLNVDVDPAGGFSVRRGWTAVNAAVVHAGTWDPRSMYVHETSDGGQNLYLASDGTIYKSLDDGATWSTTSVLCDGGQHQADWAGWGDKLYVTCGPTYDARVFDSNGTPTALTQAETGTFSTYTSPTVAFPRASVCESHGGYVFVADTEEDGVPHPYRLRWCHPNNPEAWHVDDEITIQQGGGPITALVSNGSHLLIFCQSAVYALFGSDSDSWQLVNVALGLGAVSHCAVTRGEGVVFFYSHLNGVYAIIDTQKPVEVSEQLRPMFKSSDFNTQAPHDVYLGWVDKRLYCSVPYYTTGVPNESRTIFVLDPSLENGSWMMMRGANEHGLGPFAQGGYGGGEGLPLGCSRTAAFVIDVDATSLPFDTLDDGGPVAFDSYYRTRWVHAGFPSLKKMWRRPDFIAKERSVEYGLTVTVFHDYNETIEKRSRTITVDPGGTGAVYGAFNWGDGTIYGPEAVGSRVERGGSLGSAKAVQLKVAGTPGLVWGVDGIVLKFVPRKMR